MRPYVLLYDKLHVTVKAVTHCMLGMAEQCGVAGDQIFYIIFIAPAKVGGGQHTLLVSHCLPLLRSTSPAVCPRL